MNLAGFLCIYESWKFPLRDYELPSNELENIFLKLNNFHRPPAANAVYVRFSSYENIDRVANAIYNATGTLYEANKYHFIFDKCGELPIYFFYPFDNTDENFCRKYIEV